MKTARGFTLLELLIGLSLLSFILVLLFSGFRLASTSWNAVETRIERSTHEDMAKSFLRRLLSQIQPMRWKKMADHPMSFRGGVDGIVAIAPLTGQAGSSGIRVVALSIEPDESAQNRQVRLVLREAPLRHETADFGDAILEAKSHTLLDGLAEIRFTYFGAEKKGDPPSWLEAWSSKEDLPRLIRVSVSSVTGEPFDLLVAPMVRGSRCNWDSFYKKCR